ncbi:MAG: zinc-dependent alcohol dehydrogenase [Rubrobacter sp.]
MSDSKGRALWFVGPRSAELRSAGAPAPGPDEVRVAAEYSAASAGTEMLVYRGEVPGDTPLDLPTLEGSFAFPIKYGYALAGRITEVGKNVRHLAPGDAVFVHHPHQSRMTVPANMPVRLPETVTTLEGVFFANLETALNIVHDTPGKLGETVVVMGQGAVGLLVTGLLVFSGVRVIAVDPVAIRRELAREFGAEIAVEPDGLSDFVRSETNGLGADAVVEASGSTHALGAAVGCVAAEGTVVVASWYGTKPVSLDLGGHFHRGRVRLKSSQVGSLAPELSGRWSRERRTRAVLDLMPRLGLERLVSHRVSLEDAPGGYQKLDVDEEFARKAIQVVIEYHANEA